MRPDSVAREWTPVISIMSFVKICGLICLVLVAYFISRAYAAFRAQRRSELDALCRVLLCMKEDIEVYQTFRPISMREEFLPLSVIGFSGGKDPAGELLSVVSRMNLLPAEKTSFSEILARLGEGSVQSEKEKLDNLLEKVNCCLQKEESDGKKSVDTVRIVLFTVALALVIILL